MPNPFTSTFDLAGYLAVAIAIISLGFSIYTFYITTARRFDGKAFPVSRIVLSWMNRAGTHTPCVITQVEYINMGAKVGKIDDLMLELDSDGGTVHSFRAFLVTDNIDYVLDADGQYESEGQDVYQFSTVWLAPRSSKQQAVIFQPTSMFSLEKPTMFRVKLLYYSVDNLSARKNRNKTPKIEWKQSDLCFTFSLSHVDLDSWCGHSSVMLEADEVVRSRKEHFTNRD